MTVAVILSYKINQIEKVLYETSSMKCSIGKLKYDRCCKGAEVWRFCWIFSEKFVIWRELPWWVLCSVCLEYIHGCLFFCACVSLCMWCRMCTSKTLVCAIYVWTYAQMHTHQTNANCKGNTHPPLKTHHLHHVSKFFDTKRACSHTHTHTHIHTHPLSLLSLPRIKSIKVVFSSQYCAATVISPLAPVGPNSPGAPGLPAGPENIYHALHINKLYMCT